MADYNQGDSFMYQPVSWVKGALFGDKGALAGVATVSSPTAKTTTAGGTTAGGSQSPKNLFSNLESGHSSLEATADPVTTATAEVPGGINWSIIIVIAGLVLTLFWILRKH